ncbi:MAG TPA: acyclic terpene utilization AtuA family protein [Cyclobacteriaceae bacterium]|nr:acyclic terpene utilization AtuA family protein [Cyclobacteriaceae bacterium]
MKEKIRIGCGAGFSGDRLDPSIVLVEKGNLDYLVLECLAERTIGLAQKRKLQDPTQGYDPLLERRIDSLLELLLARQTKLITNMGAANPLAAGQKVIDIAKSKKLKIKVAVLTGDDVLHLIEPVERSVSANAYLGADGILEAIKTDADVIITGRVADPSLFIAPMIHEFDWPMNDYTLMGRATVIGHLMECAGHITGGYFADPGRKDVPDMAQLGHPFADVSKDCSAVISKVEGTGGVINLMTAKEQLLYEVENPHQYFTPDVVADFTSVRLKQVGENRVAIEGGSGSEKPGNYKVSVGYQAFWLGEGEITYAGSNAVARAKLAGETVRQRLANVVKDIRVDLIGMNSVHGDRFHNNVQPYEVRLRVAGKADNMKTAQLVGEEVEALYTNGPGGGGGVRKYVNEVIGIVSTLIPRNKVRYEVKLLES